MAAPAGDPIGLFYTWWRGDALPDLPRVPGLALGPTEDERLVAELSGAAPAEVRERMQRRHRPWLARLAGQPVGYGWMAADDASIGELGIRIVLPPRDRYLWNFVTLPAWRGRGIYPRLLQAMVAHEAEAERFWVGHDLDNVASGRGITSAGFQTTGALYRARDGGFAFVASGPNDRAADAATLLGVPLAGRRGAGTA